MHEIVQTTFHLAVEFTSLTYHSLDMSEPALTNLKLIAGTANPKLAREISDCMGVRL